jgi:signal transduction histidine kinase
MWQVVRRTVGHYQELVLSTTFLLVAGYEALEIWVLERPGSWSPSLPIHAVQVAVILSATAVAVRAWQRKTAHQEALARLVERVVFAQDEERRRIAYELHDGISPLVVSAKQHLETSRDLRGLDPARADRQLDTAVERLALAIAEMRRVLGALRPSSVASRGLAAAARQSLEEAAAEARWTVVFNDTLGDQRLPAVVETAAFRILQEALANVRKHARAGHVEVDLRPHGNWLHLDVRDNGIGVSAGGEGRGLGLYSMRERAQLVGGRCAVEPGGERGTWVRVQLPLSSSGGTESAR